MVYTKYINSTFIGQIWPKNFKSPVYAEKWHMITFLVFDWKYPFQDFAPKLKIKVKFGTQSNSNMQDSMVMFNCSVFDKKYPFWVNLVQKLKIVSLRWNMGPRLIHIWRIQWWCSLFLFSTASTFFGQIWSKKFKIVSLGWNLGPSLIWTCRIQWWCLLVLFSIENILFRQIWSKNSKLSV